MAEERFLDFTNRTFFERLQHAFEKAVHSVIHERASALPAPADRYRYIERSLTVQHHSFRLVFFFPNKPTTSTSRSVLPSAAPSTRHTSAASLDLSEIDVTVTEGAGGEGEGGATGGDEGLRDARYLQATVRQFFGAEAGEQGAVILSEPIEGSEEARPLEGQPQAQQAVSALILAVRHILDKGGAQAKPSTVSLAPAAPSETGDGGCDNGGTEGLGSRSESARTASIPPSTAGTTTANSSSSPTSLSLVPFTAVAFHFDRSSSSRSLALIDALRGRRVGVTGLQLRPPPTLTSPSSPPSAPPVLFRLESSESYDVRTAGEILCNPSGALRSLGLLLRSCWAEDARECAEAAAALDRPSSSLASSSSMPSTSYNPFPLRPTLTVGMTFRLPSRAQLTHAAQRKEEAERQLQHQAASRTPSDTAASTSGFPPDDSTDPSPPPSDPTYAWDLPLPWKRWTDYTDPIGSLELELSWRHLALEQVVGKEWSPTTAASWRLHVLPARLGTDPPREGSADSVLGYRRATSLQAPSDFTSTACFKNPDEDTKGTLVRSLDEGILQGALEPVLRDCGGASLGDLAGEEYWEQVQGAYAPRVPPEGVLLDLLRDILDRSDAGEERRREARGGDGFGARDWESVLARFALHAGMLGTPRAVAALWLRLVREFRFSYWDHLQRIPGVFPPPPNGIPRNPSSPSAPPSHPPGAVVDALGAPLQSHSPSPSVDHSKPLLLQKLQLLDMCIARRQDRGDVPTPYRMRTPEDGQDWAAIAEEPALPPSLSCDDEGRPRGVAKVLLGVFLLDDPSEPLRAPEVADCLSCTTSDFLYDPPQEQAAAGGGAGRAQLNPLRVASLKSDIAAFKAANPRATFEDFIRWFSPRDFQEEERRLSPRMAPKDCLWQVLWAQATPRAVRDQPPLLDPRQEGERILHLLETMAPASLMAEMAWFACDAITTILEQTCRICVHRPVGAPAKTGAGVPSGATPKLVQQIGRGEISKAIHACLPSGLSALIEDVRARLDALLVPLTSPNQEDLLNDAVPGFQAWAGRAYDLERAALMLGSLSQRLGTALMEPEWADALLQHLQLIPCCAAGGNGAQSQYPGGGLEIPHGQDGKLRKATWDLLLKGMGANVLAPQPLDQHWEWRLRGNKIFVQWCSDSKLTVASTVQMNA